MKWVYIVLIFFISCKKSENNNGFKKVNYTYQQVWNKTGISYEQKYWFYQQYIGDTIIFHQNNTITEIYINDTIIFGISTYAVDTFIHLAIDPSGKYEEERYIVYKADSEMNLNYHGIGFGLISQFNRYDSLNLEGSTLDTLWSIGGFVIK